MDLDQLRAFVAVSKQEHLSKAATSIGVQVSTLSRLITSLEREWGGALFYRTGRGMQLSELGNRLLQEAADIVERSESLSRNATARAGVLDGVVRVGLVPSLVQILVVPLYTELRERHPGIVLHLTEGSSEELDALKARGDIDVSVLFRYSRMPANDEVFTAKVDNYLMGAKGDSLTAQPTVEFQRLSSLPLLLPGQPNEFRTLFDHLVRKHNIRPLYPVEADTLSIQAELTARGCGYSIMASHAAVRQVQAGALQAALIVNPTFSKTIAISWPAGKPASGATREVVRRIRQIAEREFD